MRIIDARFFGIINKLECSIYRQVLVNNLEYLKCKNAPFLARLLDMITY
jgi:hypothetical protein